MHQHQLNLKTVLSARLRTEDLIRDDTSSIRIAVREKASGRHLTYGWNRIGCTRHFSVIEAKYRDRKFQTLQEVVSINSAELQKQELGGGLRLKNACLLHALAGNRHTFFRADIHAVFPAPQFEVRALE